MSYYVIKCFVHATKPLMFRATKFHCFLTATCTNTQQKPAMYNLGSNVQCAANIKPAPI